MDLEIFFYILVRVVKWSATPEITNNLSNERCIALTQLIGRYAQTEDLTVNGELYHLGKEWNECRSHYNLLICDIRLWSKSRAHFQTYSEIQEEINNNRITRPSYLPLTEVTNSAAHDRYNYLVSKALRRCNYNITMRRVDTKYGIRDLYTINYDEVKGNVVPYSDTDAWRRIIAKEGITFIRPIQQLQRKCKLC